MESTLLWGIFICILVGIFVSHKNSLQVAIVGCLLLGVLRFIIGFDGKMGIEGMTHHLSHEWVGVINIFMLILGFELVAQYFSRSNLPILIPSILPDDWKGGFWLLAIIFVCSAFLDNIAAAMIGGAIAKTVFNGKVSTGYVAAIVASSNAGGAGSVIGDTTTTMMWVAGIGPMEVLTGYIGSITAFCFFAVFAAKQQQAFHPIMKDPPKSHHKIDFAYLGIVITILALAISTNIVINDKFREFANSLPWIGMAVWIGILATSFIRRPHMDKLKSVARSGIFLSALILSASMMPIDSLGKAGTLMTFNLGVSSAGFDNIPLTRLAIAIGGFAWGLLAYAVGFGGSMTWFGSSAGVAISSDFPESRDLKKWVKQGWFVFPAYVLGFVAIVLFNAFV